MAKNSFRTILNLASNTRAFTLAELGISIVITALVILGASFFITRVNSDILGTKNRTQVHIDLTTFIEKMNSVRTNFSS